MACRFKESESDPNPPVLEPKSKLLRQVVSLRPPPSAPSDNGNKPWVLNTRRGTLPTSTLVNESQGKIVPYNYQKRSDQTSVCEAVNSPAHTRQDFKQVVGH